MRVCLGSRRNFICRLKLGSAPPSMDPVQHERSLRLRARSALGPSCDGYHYALVHVTGYVKNWSMSGVTGQVASSNPGKLFGKLRSVSKAKSSRPRLLAPTGLEEGHEDPNGSTSHGMTQCLVALGRLQVTSVPNTNDLSPHSQYEFVTRHAADTTTTFCDQRVSSVLGLHTHDVLGKPLLDLLHPDDKRSFQEAAEQSESSLIPCFHFIRFSPVPSSFSFSYFFFPPSPPLYHSFILPLQNCISCIHIKFGQLTTQSPSTCSVEAEGTTDDADATDALRYSQQQQQQ